jgi:DNA-binding GntR family transcriptional regulator
LNTNNLHSIDQRGSGGSNEGRPGRRSALAPVGRETLHERVYAELRRSLIHGVFEAGQVLRIVELAETLQTSTMPVREALARLVSEQALEALPNRSVRVPLVTRERLDDLALARPLIEEQLVALALPNLSRDDFKELRRLTLACEAAFKSEDPDKARTTSELNHAFHFYIYQAARSAVLIPIVESLWLQSGPYVRAAAHIHDENRGIPAVHHHWALIEALERGDKDGAKRALTDDITRSFDLVRSRLVAAGNGDGQE